MKKYRWYQIIFILVFSVLANAGGRIFADSFQLPLWLDSFGTFFTAYVLGPVWGAVAGVCGNFFYSFFNPLSLIYSITSVCIALVVGFFAKRGWMQNLLKTMSLSVLVTVICVIISCILNFHFHDGKIGNIWGQGIAELLETWKFPRAFSVMVGQFYMDFLDKVITLWLLYFSVRIYRRLKIHLPGFLKIQTDDKSAAKNNGGVKKLAFAFFFIASLINPARTEAQNIFRASSAAQTDFTSQPKNYNSYIHQIYNKENGLPGGKANDIASTNDGILWIGTYEGLYRHNGHEFRLMNDLESIKTVRCLYVDDEGRLFVGTNDNGLSVIINENVAYVLDEKDALPAAAVRCITKAADGYYYAGTSEELVVISIEDDAEEGLIVYSIIPQIQCAVRVTADANGNVACLTVDGDIYILNNRKIVWDSKSTAQKFTTVRFAPDGSLYSATETNSVVVFSAVSYDAQQAIACNPLRHINSLNFFEGVCFLTSDSGVGYIEGNAFQIIETGAFNNSIDNMTQDYQGNLWFTSSRLGLLKMCEASFSEVYTAAGLSEAVVNSVTSFAGDLYFGTDNGLTVADGVTGLAKRNVLTSQFANVRIRCVRRDSSGKMWICTQTHGLVCAYDEKHTVTFGSGHVYREVIELSDGTILAGGNDGLVFIKNDQIVCTLGREDGFENSIVLSISEHPNGDIIAGTDGGGLVIIRKADDAQAKAGSLDEKPYKITSILKRGDGLTSNVILRTVNDYDGTVATGGVFLVTSNGLCYMTYPANSAGKDASIAPVANFPYSNNYDLVILDNKNVFVLSSAGIFVVNRDELLSGEKLSYELLDLKNGLRGSLTANSWNYVDDDGNIYLSTDRGVSKINLYEYDKNKHTYRIQVKSILIDGKRFVVQKRRAFCYSCRK